MSEQMSDYHRMEREAVQRLSVPEETSLYRLALRTIAEFPIPEQDNMIAANMRQIAKRALET